MLKTVDALKRFILDRRAMRMVHLYKPLMIQAVTKHGGTATREQIALAFGAALAHAGGPRPATPEELRTIARDLPQATAMATGDVAKAREALQRERTSYETALAACEREREDLAGKVVALDALRQGLGDAGNKLDAALAVL